MKSSIKKARRQNGTQLLLLFSLLCALVSSPALSSAANPAVSSAQPVMGISVTNNSTREIRHLYLSPVDRNNWGPDLLDGAIMRNGESFTISDAACTGNEIKVIAEDDKCSANEVVAVVKKFVLPDMEAKLMIRPATASSIATAARG